MANSYESFLKTKEIRSNTRGIDKTYDLHPILFDFQSACVRRGLKQGRLLLGEACGLGKTFQELEYARVIHEHTNKNVLIAAPLAVAQQTIKEAKKIDVKVNLCRTKSDVKKGLNITNYEMLHHFDASDFIGFCGDELSIIKNYAGKLRNLIIEMFNNTPFRLGASATPCPNDHTELANYAEFLGIMKRMEMLATFFIHDGGSTADWRLKGHGQEAFWSWLASWAIMMGKPSDIGFEDGAFILPPLKTHRHILDSDFKSSEYLFPMPAKSLNEQRAVKRDTLGQRVKACADIVNATDEQFLVFCELNDEGDALEKAINGAEQISGSDELEDKESRLLGFVNGDSRVLVTKPSLSGYGLNLQNCRNIAFVNLSHSWEDQYQAVRRCWRFGQKKEVRAHYFISELELSILDNINRKEKQAEEMKENMIEHMAEAMKMELGVTTRQTVPYEPKKTLEIPQWIKS